MTSTTDYQTLARLFVDAMASDFYNAVWHGLFGNVSQLPSRDQQALEEQAASYRGLAELIGASIPFSCYPSELLDLTLAMNWLRALALETTVTDDGTPMYMVKPDALQALLGLTPAFLERDPREKGTILSELTTRMQGLPHYLNQELERLDRPVAAWVELEREAAAGFPAFRQGVMLYAQQVGYYDMAGLESILKTAQLWVGIYANKLAQMPTRGFFSIGEESTQRLLQLKGIEVPLQDIYTIAHDHIAKTFQELEEMKESLLEKYDLSKDMTIYDLAKYLKEKFASPEEEFIELCQRMSSKAAEFAQDKGLIVSLENARFSISITPAYLQPLIPVAAMFPPSPALDVRESTLFFTLSEPLLQELNQLFLPTVVAHEGDIGHHYQHARALDNPSPFRRWISPMDLAEGWTTFVAEKKMLETGYCWKESLALDERYMATINFLRLGGRVCFALACLTGERKYLENNFGIVVDAPDILDASAQFYQGLTGYKDSRAKSEVTMFSAEGTYPLLYLVGHNLMQNMEVAARQRQGDTYSLQTFLEAILDQGNMPLSYITHALQADGIL